MKTRRVLSLIMTVAMLLSLLGPSLALAEAELLPDDVDIIALDGEAVVLPNLDDLGDLGDLDLGDLVIGDVEPGADLDGADIDAPDAGEETSADGGIAMASYYAVTFDTQGGEPVPELQMVEEGGYAQRPEDPTRDRSAFTGWYLDGEDYFANPTPINSDVTLTAGWEVEQLEQVVGEKPDEEPRQQFEDEIEFVDQPEGEGTEGGESGTEDTEEAEGQETTEADEVSDGTEGEEIFEEMEAVTEESSYAGSEAEGHEFVFYNGPNTYNKPVTDESPFVITVWKPDLTHPNVSKSIYLWIDGKRGNDFGDELLDLLTHITYESSDPNIATVTKLGKGYQVKIIPVQGKSGNVTIKALFDGVKVAEAPVTVKYVAVDSVSYPALTMYLDQVVTLNAASGLVIEPEDATITSITAATDDTDGIIEIKQTDPPKITAKKAGTANVTVTTQDFSGVSYTFKVTMLDEDPIKIGDVGYKTLNAAVDAAKDGDVIDVNANMNGDGIMIGSGKNITIDFHDHTYVARPNAGSTGTKSQSIHIDSNSSVTMKNGTVKGDAVGSYGRMLMQNYGDLTLDNMVLDGSMFNGQSNVANFNSGNSEIKGDSKIILPKSGSMTVNMGGEEDWYPHGATLTLDGVTVEGGSLKTIGGTTPSASAMLEVKNAELGKAEYTEGYGAVVNVYPGATSTTPVPMEDCAPGYYPIALLGGKYSVTDSAVAYVEGTGLAYKTFAEAVEATKADSVTDKTITLLANVVDAYTMSVGETLKIYEKKYTITVKAPAGYTLNQSTDEDNVTTYTLSANTYTVAYNANGGGGTMANQSFTYDDKTQALTANAFTREGYLQGVEHQGRRQRHGVCR